MDIKFIDNKIIEHTTENLLNIIENHSGTVLDLNCVIVNYYHHEYYSDIFSKHIDKFNKFDKFIYTYNDCNKSIIIKKLLLLLNLNFPEKEIEFNYDSINLIRGCSILHLYEFLNNIKFLEKHLNNIKEYIIKNNHTIQKQECNDINLYRDNILNRLFTWNWKSITNNYKYQLEIIDKNNDLPWVWDEILGNTNLNQDFLIKYEKRFSKNNLIQYFNQCKVGLEAQKKAEFELLNFNRNLSISSINLSKIEFEYKTKDCFDKLSEKNKIIIIKLLLLNYNYLNNNYKFIVEYLKNNIKILCKIMLDLIKIDNTSNINSLINYLYNIKDKIKLNKEFYEICMKNTENIILKKQLGIYSIYDELYENKYDYIDEDNYQLEYKENEIKEFYNSS
jgi:hypothetical protein